jgi:copper chaperone NosL
VPFGNREAADAFAATNGGRVMTFAEIPSAYVLGSDAPGEQSEQDHTDVRLN